MAVFTRYLSLLILNFTIANACFALAYNIVPKAGTTLPKTIILGTTQTAFYTVTNNTGKKLAKGFVKYLPKNVKQVTSNPDYLDLCGSSFTLMPKKSCTLQLTISGEVKASDPDPKFHLFICTPQVLACAGTPYPLNVTALVPTVRGTVQSGGGDKKIIANALVSVYKTKLQTAEIIGQAQTDSKGKFYLYIPQNSIVSGATYYALASKGNNIKLVTIMGEKPLPTIVINEMTTVAAAYSMAQFLNGNLIYGKVLGLKIAALMNANLVNPITGNLSAVMTKSPNANETNSMRSLSSLANLIAPCVRNNTNFCTALFSTSTFDGITPKNTLEALLSVAHHHANHVLAIYALTLPLKIYTPYLIPVQKPDAWTVAVKFNNSGNESCPFGGPAKTKFDKNGFAWITNNVVQGTPNSAKCIIVLQPNGQPSSGTHNTPTSTIFGGGILGTAYGIDIDLNNSIWVGDFGWGQCSDCIPTSGAISQISGTGIPISGPSGYTSFIQRAQGVAIDKNNNIWIASSGNDRIVVFPNGNPNEAIYYQEPESSGPFEVVIDSKGAAWVTNSTSATVNKFIIQNNQLVQKLSVAVGNQLKGMTIDSLDNLWIASFGNSVVYELDSLGNIVNTVPAGAGGVDKPWGVTIDSDDNVWVANFTDLDKLINNHYSVSKICGSNPAACPPGINSGDPISPATGYTLPTGGSQVLLADGTPLNGPNSIPSFFPLMRSTQSIPDRAGNLWVTNNWKPRPFQNLFTNPGGDGMVVFVGLAKPSEN